MSRVGSMIWTSWIHCGSYGSSGIKCGSSNNGWGLSVDPSQGLSVDPWDKFLARVSGSASGPMDSVNRITYYFHRID